MSGKNVEFFKKRLEAARKRVTELKSYGKFQKLIASTTTIAPMTPLILLLCGLPSILLASVSLMAIITKKIIAVKAKEVYPNSISCVIRERKKNAVHVGIFEESNTYVGDIIIESSQGTSPDLVIGEVIYV